jgi:protease-4
MKKYLLKFIVFFIVCLFSINVNSQMTKDPVSEGMNVPAQSLIDSEGAFSFEKNPASIGFFNGLNFDFLYCGEKDKSSAGFFLAAKPSSFLGIGTGAEYLDDPFSNNKFLRGIIGFAVSPDRSVSLGLKYNFHVSNSDRNIDGMNSFDLALLLMPSSAFSIGMKASNINRPFTGSVPVERYYSMGIGLRPFGHMVTFSGDLGIREESETADALFKLSSEPFKGINISAALGMMPFEKEKQFFGAILLSLKLGYARFFAGSDFDENKSSFSAGFGASAERISSVIENDNLLVTIDISGRLIEGDSNVHGTHFTDVVTKLKTIMDDPDIAGIIFRMFDAGIGYAQAQEISQILRQLKNTGKKIYFYIDSVSAQEYLLASQGDGIFINPAGMIDISGVSVTLTFIRDLLNNIGIQAQFFSAGRYKNFPEIFLRSSASDELKEVENELINEYYSTFLDTVSSSRKIPRETLEKLLKISPFTASKAVREHLADEISNPDDITEIINAKKTGLSKEDSRNFVFLPEYFDIRWRQETWGEPESIAVIHINGSIMEGESFSIPVLDAFITGSETVVRAIEQAVSDRNIAGIIIRIDSPGGSISAAERIYQALRKASGIKPTAASLSNVAASGGYYAACGAKKIFSEGLSITGSIGIWWGKFAFSGLFSKIGLSREVIKKGERSDMLGIDRTLTDEEAGTITENLDEYYNLFIKRVSEGRSLPEDIVSQYAEGRVFMGKSFFEKKLIDEIGGLLDAENFIKKESGISPSGKVNLKVLPGKKFSQKVADYLKEQGMSLNGMNILQALIPSAAGNIVSFIMFNRAENSSFALMPYIVE